MGDFCVAADCIALGVRLFLLCRRKHPVGHRTARLCAAADCIALGVRLFFVVPLQAPCRASHGAALCRHGWGNPSKGKSVGVKIMLF